MDTAITIAAGDSQTRDRQCRSRHHLGIDELWPDEQPAGLVFGYGGAIDGTAIGEGSGDRERSDTFPIYSGARSPVMVSQGRGDDIYSGTLSQAGEALERR